MARYDVRDLLGHWVKPKSGREKMCPHACCRGKRVHPDNYPVILPDRLLRRASDHDLAEHYGKTSDEKHRAQILHEMDRRDRQTASRAAAQERSKSAAFSKRLERAEAVDHAWLAAEKDTNGNMLNKAGKAAGIDERSLFTGPEARARRYASHELLEHWQTHPRPTAAMFAGKDTRVYESYTSTGQRTEDHWLYRRPGQHRARRRLQSMSTPAASETRRDAAA